MSRTLSSLSASVCGFTAGYVAPSLLFMLWAYASRSPAGGEHGSPFDNYAMALYLAGVYALGSAAAYAIITALSDDWGGRSWRQIATISALAGTPAQILSWTGLSIIFLAPFLSTMPRNVSMALTTAMPGVIAGLLVLLWVSTRSQPEARAVKMD